MVPDANDNPSFSASPFGHDSCWGQSSTLTGPPDKLLPSRCGGM